VSGLRVRGDRLEVSVLTLSYLQKKMKKKIQRFRLMIILERTNL